MKRNSLDQYASILSVPPVFDEKLAVEYGTNPQLGIARNGEEVVKLLRELKMCGMVVRMPGSCWRVSDVLRKDLQKELQREQKEVYQRVVRIYLSHANRRFLGRLKTTLGLSAAEISRVVLKLSISDSKSDFNKLVDIVQEGTWRGRGSDARCALSYLDQLPYYAGKERQEAFFHALWLWRHNDRYGASFKFDEVLRHPEDDLADAISAHLIAVLDIEQGNEHQAIPLLHRALAGLESMNHRRGTVLVLTTLGRAQREIATRCKAMADDPKEEPSKRENHGKSAVEYFTEAQENIGRAYTLASELGDGSILATANLELAIAFERAGQLDQAIEVAEQAREEVPLEDRELMARTLTLLGSLYRKHGDNSAAAVVLDEALEYLVDPTLELAKLLNVLASAERQTKHLLQARQHAEESVAIGRRLGNPRHIAHALSTLASIVIDSATSENDLNFVASCLDESNEILERLNDYRGISIIARLRKSSEQKRKELDSS